MQGPFPSACHAWTYRDAYRKWDGSGGKKIYKFIDRNIDPVRLRIYDINLPYRKTKE